MLRPVKVCGEEPSTGCHAVQVQVPAQQCRAVPGEVCEQVPQVEEYQEPQEECRSHRWSAGATGGVQEPAKTQVQADTSHGEEEDTKESSSQGVQDRQEGDLLVTQ